MNDVVFVRPRAGKPDFGLPQEGAERPRTVFWLRRIRDEDVELIERTAALEQQQPASAETTTTKAQQKPSAEEE